ncbi:retrovirus-related pol polyprotein from transposon TNT 1-94 [Tanacetum coccineum]
MQQLMPNPEDITDPTTAMNMALVLIAKESGCSECSSESRRSDVENQDGLIVVLGIANQNPNGNGNVVVARVEGNANGNNGNQIRCYNCRGLGHLARNCTVRPRRRDAAYLQTQLLIAQKEEAGIQLQAEEFDLMAAAADLDEIEEVNANCILMANLQQALTSGTQTNKAPVYDLDGSAELLEPIPEPHQVQQNDSNVISEVSSAKQSGGTVDQHPVTVEETRAYFESFYNNLAIEVEKLSKKNSTVSSLFEEKKKLKSDFKIREDGLLDKKIQLDNKIKELDNILIKTGQSIQTMHMLSPKPDSFYHTEQKMALGYQNPFYLKQAQQKQQSLYNGKVLLGKHDPPVVYDSEETLELAQESRLKMK